MPEKCLRHMALLGSYLPRQCGIATFTRDVYCSLAGGEGKANVSVLALDEENEPRSYPQEVCFQIREQEESDYELAADLLNINQAEVTLVQHEYGIFGGRDGILALNFLRRLRMPVIVTLHTVLEEPTPGQDKVMREIIAIADRVVVMSERGERILRRVYQAPKKKIAFIHHGIPDVPFSDSSFFKDRFALEGRMVMLTFGLLSSGKGIETVIEAMPPLVKRHPELIYLVLGATHPKVLREEGDAYRNSLERMVTRLGLENHVMFHNRFVQLEELCHYLGAADIYVTPYLNRGQITSGTLAYACGAGKAVISTPYRYAEELLADGRGLLFPAGDSRALAGHIDTLLENPVDRNAMRKKAYLFGREMIWPEVGRRYLELGEKVIRERLNQPRSVGHKPTAGVPGAMPKVDLRHLRTMTDGTGICQHAIYTIPNRHHGYCTDDNSRALIATLRHYELRRQDQVLSLINIYLAFLHSAFRPDTGHFHNFMDYSRHWTDEQGSKDSHARAIWALGEAVSLAPNSGVLGYATRLFNDALAVVTDFDSPRAWAFALAGIHSYLERFGGDTNVRRSRDILAGKLKAAFDRNQADDWPWCEDKLTYDNGKLPHALLLAGKSLPDERLRETGLKSLDWLFRIQTSQEGYINVIGCQGWYPRDGKAALFDQQPVELMSLSDAAAEAYRQTGDSIWRRRVRLCLDWFLGSNLMGVPLYDFKTGGCRDGLTPQGANANQGAESTLAWLTTLLTATEMEGRERVDKHPSALAGQTDE